MQIDILATLHLADLFHDPKMTAPTIRDWRKVRRYLDGAWPKPVPPVYQVHPQAGGVVIERALDWFLGAHDNASILAIDTEFNPTTGDMWLCGLGYPEMDGGLQLWGQPHATLISALTELVARVPVVFQNAVADIPILEQNVGIRYTGYKRIDDTMLAHAVLWSDHAHDLEYLASVYSVYPKMKHLMHVDASMYNWGDVLDTLLAWRGLSQELASDPASAAIYHTQSLPLIPIIIDYRKRGLRVNAARVGPAREEYEYKLGQATRLARAYTGLPQFNLGSPKQVAWWLYQVEGLDKRKNRKTRKVSVDDDALAALRAKVGPEADPDTPESYTNSLERIELGANPVIEARVLYAAAQQSNSHYIEPLIED